MCNDSNDSVARQPNLSTLEDADVGSDPEQDTIDERRAEQVQPVFSVETSSAEDEDEDAAALAFADLMAGVKEEKGRNQGENTRRQNIRRQNTRCNFAFGSIFSRICEIPTKVLLKYKTGN